MELVEKRDGIDGTVRCLLARGQVELFVIFNEDESAAGLKDC